jgi:ABC-type uncharacterized transport system substrate-binding protein
MYRDLKVSVRKTYINIITIAATPTFRALRSRTSEDNRPEANVTGASIASGPLAQKRLELILEMIPHATVIGYLENQGLASFELYTRNIATAAQSKGREVVPFGASTEQEIDTFHAAPVLNSVSSPRAGAVMPAPPLDILARRADCQKPLTL